MKIIHSFWSKPAFHNNQEYHNSRKFGGWINFRYFLISQFFSCLTFRKHHQSIDLYTDTEGYDLFINDLKLPYSNVSLLLNKLSNENHKLWILGKLLVIKNQHEPFIHVDNDVYIWESLLQSSSHDFIVAQSELPTPDVYKTTLREVQDNFKDVPNSLMNVRDTIANVGVIGGNCIDFFQDFCETSERLIQKNIDNLDKVNIGGLNQIIEEYLFSSMVIERELPIKYIVNTSSYKAPMASVLRFNMVPFVDKYIHLLGIAKQNYYACEQLELRAKYEFPEHFNNYMEIVTDKYQGLQSLPEITASLRNRRLNDILKKVYNSSLSEIENLKLALSNDVSLKKSEIYKGQYVISYRHPETNIERNEELTGEDNLLALFTSTISIRQVLNEYRTSKDPEEKEYNLFKIKFIDWVTENLIVRGFLDIISF